jgi:hypothetical protein
MAKSDYWIVTTFPFVEHKTLERAEKEAARLREKVPSKTFSIIRCKRDLRPSAEKAELGARVLRLEAACRNWLNWLDAPGEGSFDGAAEHEERLLADMRAAIGDVAETEAR